LKSSSMHQWNWADSVVPASREGPVYTATALW